MSAHDDKFRANSHIFMKSGNTFTSQNFPQLLEILTSTVNNIALWLFELPKRERIWRHLFYGQLSFFGTLNDWRVGNGNRAFAGLP
jgi:hypothetical protein